MNLLAPALCCGLAAWLIVRPAPAVVLRSRLGSPGVTIQPQARLPAPSVLVAAAAVASAALALSTRPAATLLPLSATAGVVVGMGGLLLQRSRSRVRAAARRVAVIEACDALAAGLRAGQQPARVLARVALDVGLLAPAAAAARLGGDVPTALLRCAGIDGAAGLAMLASAWTVATRSGAGLAEVAAQIAGTVRSDADQRRQVEVALATSRSTARLLAGLPVLGVVLGTGIDADPVGVLFGSPAGAWCLLAGVLLAAVGVLWVERLADGALR